MNQQNNKLVLGTVQLGMKYGLNNTHGQPTEEEAFSILDTALTRGIDTFDTAWAYGTAEDVLGAWIKNRSLVGKVKIISKMKPHALNDYPDGTKAVDVVKMEIEKSLRRLNIPKLDGYLFHSPYYIYITHLIEGLQTVKESGLVKNIGVSIYDEAEALQAVELGIDYIQIPYNSFDQRLDATNFFDLAKKNKVTTFARSPFLQGLLLMQPKNLPNHLFYLHPQLQKFIDISNHYKLEPVTTALKFVDNQCRSDYIVFGVETCQQLEQNINLMQEKTSVLDNNLIADLVEAFKDFNRGAVNPSLWSKIKR